MSNFPEAQQDSRMINMPADDEIDLLELWNVLWQSKWLIIMITAVFAAGSVVVALMMTNIYRAEALLAPADEQSQGAGSALLSQFGGLAGLAGISLGGGGGDVTKAIATLKSRQFTEAFIARHNLLVPLMAGEWDKSQGKSVIDPELYNEQTQQWVRDVKPPKTPEPSAWEAFKAFSKIMAVAEDKKTGLITLSIEWHDPEEAQQWVNWLIEDVNNTLKQQDLREAERSIAYLEEQLAKTQLVDMQQVFYQLIESQTKTIMLADARDDYVFQVIDPAVVPEEKAKPKRALICVLGTMLGGMLAVFFVLIRHFVRKRKSEVQI